MSAGSISMAVRRPVYKSEARVDLTPSKTVPLKIRQVIATQEGPVATGDAASDTETPVVPASLQDLTTGIAVATVRPSGDEERQLDIPGIMGLIMPNPYGPIYAGLTYRFGFVEPGPRPFRPIEGWTRTLLPILIMPNYTADVFPTTGDSEPDESLSNLCSVSIEPGPVVYEFTFDTAGWHEYVINQTWYQPSTNEQGLCRSPLRFQYTFFSAQLLSVSPMPTVSPPPVPVAAQTYWAKVTRETPEALPIDPLPSTDNKKIIAGMSVFGALVALALIALVLWTVKKRRKDEQERLAFSRLPQEEQQAYLLQNPRIFRNAPLSFRQQHEALVQQQLMHQQQQMQFYPPHTQPLMAQYRPPPPYPSMMSQNAMPPFPAQPGSFGFMSRRW